MADLQQSVDPTGSMSQTDLHSQDIQNIINEFNRLTNKLGSSNQLSLYSDGSNNRYEIGYQTDGWGSGKNVGIKASKPGVEVTTATDIGLTYKDDFTTKTWYDNTKPRILEGLLPDSSYGMWISKPGIDVTTATTSQLIFNSNQNVFKIALTGSYTMTVADPLPADLGTTSASVAHGLGITPAYNIYLSGGAGLGINPGEYHSLPKLDPGLFGGADYQPGPTVTAWVDATNINFKVVNYTSVGVTGIGDLTFKYYLFQETAN